MRFEINGQRISGAPPSMASRLRGWWMIFEGRFAPPQKQPRPKRGLTWGRLGAQGCQPARFVWIRPAARAPASASRFGFGSNGIFDFQPMHSIAPARDGALGLLAFVSLWLPKVRNDEVEGLQGMWHVMERRSGGLCVAPLVEGSRRQE